MPIYEYQCQRCGEVFEVFQKLSDEPLTRCRHCRGKVERLISQSSFQLKGSGWYMTDYARSPTGGTSDSETKSTEKPEKNTSPSTKPEKTE